MGNISICPFESMAVLSYHYKVEIVLGNKTTKLSKEELNDFAKCYGETIVDLGTGNGRFVYKSAIKNPDNFYIGVDPSEKQLKEYSRKAVRKKLSNVIFCLGSIEILPKELENLADKVFVLLPWGTLLQNVVLPSRETIFKFYNLLKNKGELKIIFGYHQKLEPAEIERLELPSLSKNYIESHILPKFLEQGFVLKKLEELTKADLRQLETTWSKKLSFGKMREIFKLTLTKK